MPSNEYSSLIGRSLTQILILSLLSEEAMSGYSIIKKLKERSLILTNQVGMLKYKVGTLYGYLTKMEKNGWLIQSEQEGERGIDKKTVYSLSKTGIQALQQGIDNWVMTRSIIDGILKPGKLV